MRFALFLDFDVGTGSGPNGIYVAARTANDARNRISRHTDFAALVLNDGCYWLLLLLLRRTFATHLFPALLALEGGVVVVVAAVQLFGVGRRWLCVVRFAQFVAGRRIEVRRFVLDFVVAMEGGRLLCRFGWMRYF